MTDRFEAMSVLLAVVDAGSFSGAARILEMPLATVSRKVSELEALLKIRVLKRSTRQLSLTEAGHSYVTACRRIILDLEETERAASGEYAAPRGDLVITAPIVFGRLHVLPVVAAFLKEYPEIDVQLRLTDSMMHLMEDQVDVALRVGELPDSNFVARKIGSIRQVVCASPAYLFARGTPAQPQDLASHDCITFEGLYSAQKWRFESGKNKLDVPIHARLTSSTAEATIDAAVAGVGIARVLSYQITDAVRMGKLRRLLEEYEPAPWPVSMLHAGQRMVPLKLRAFLDFAAPRLEDRLESS